MKLLVSNSICPYFNLATEAYFLQNTEENILFIWQSESAVVSGKHQNICAEINFKFCKENIFQHRSRCLIFEQAGFNMYFVN